MSFGTSNPSPFNKTPGTVPEEFDSSSALSWSAVIGGAVAAIALTLILLAFGAGWGLDLMPAAPMQISYKPATQIRHTFAIWLIFIQWVSSALGGYLAGRLRVKWIGVHTHEVFFRDTAHGFLMWCVTTIVFALLATATVSSASRMMNDPHAPMAFSSQFEPALRNFNKLFRTDHTSSESDIENKTQARELFMRDVREGSLPESDKTYLVQLTSSSTGASPSDAEQAVDSAVTEARQSQETFHKALGMIATWTLVSMLIGAFIACAAAALGGQERDAAPPPTR